MAEWWYNTLHHLVINMTPYRDLYGRNPRSMNYHHTANTKNAWIDVFLWQRAAMQVLLKNNKNRGNNGIYANKHQFEHIFEEGDEVYLKV